MMVRCPIIGMTISVVLLAVGIPGGSASAFSSAPTSTGFGFSSFAGSFGGDTQAGSHPPDVTIEFKLNSGERNGRVVTTGGELRGAEVNLPPGLIGDPSAVPQCTRVELDAGSEGCPAASRVGTDFAELSVSGPLAFEFPVYNMVPPPGIPAQFAFDLNGIATFLDAGVRSGSDYGITVHTDNVPQREVFFNRATIWGVPSEHGTGAAPKPFLTLPTSCEGPKELSVEAISWEELNEQPQFARASVPSPGITGCQHLAFNPTIAARTDTSQADTPAGLTVEVRAPQEGLTAPGGLAESDIKATTVTLPEGVVINPGQATGLAACQESEAHIHVEGESPSCPPASKVGVDEAELPILKDKLTGGVYVLQSQGEPQLSNPPNLELLITASGDGVEVKLVAHIHLDERTGRLRTTLTEIPQAPVSTFKLIFSGGARAALVTPPTCGVYSTTSDFTPWSTPFVADRFPTSSFAVTSGAGGTPCPPSPLPFSPTMIAGSTTDQAGGYTNFSLLLQRADDQQRIGALQFKTPPGLLGMISQIQLCPEPQASLGTCPAASQIGHTVAASGPGSYPLIVPEPGKPPAPIYLTGSYRGAPYGLSIAVPVIAGPFNLGTQVVRASINVDPHTAQLTITTDPPGTSYAIPPVLDGIPTDLRTINAVVDRPGFMFNPTNCTPTSFDGFATSTEGATAPLSYRFQVLSCRSLTFNPGFKVSTSAKTSRKNGANLDVKVIYPSTPPESSQATSQANIRSVKVELPKQLPSRLTTLQKACLANVFESNPAGCPAASVVGHATVHTPILPVPLTGPVYFVSHGGEAFPSLIIVLQGYGVTADLVGATFISKKGITSSTFKSVPDVPFTSFELTLPEGPHSALTANGNLCNAKSSLVMPTQFAAQNGLELRQKIKITVAGCSKKKHRKPSRKQPSSTRPSSTRTASRFPSVLPARVEEHDFPLSSSQPPRGPGWTNPLRNYN